MQVKAVQNGIRSLIFRTFVSRFGGRGERSLASGWIRGMTLRFRGFWARKGGKACGTPGLRPEKEMKYRFDAD